MNDHLHISDTLHFLPVRVCVCMLAVNHPFTPKSLHLCLEWTVDGGIEWLQYASYPPGIMAIFVFVSFIDLRTSSDECALNESNTSKHLLLKPDIHFAILK